MTKKILVLGAEGMVGRIAYKYLLSNRSFVTLGTSRSKKSTNLLYYNFPTNNDSLEKFLQKEKIEYFINCIGVLRNSKNNNYSPNYLLPKYLEKLNKKYKFKVIQASTDGVFSETSGKVSEQDLPLPSDDYGKSKLRGEVYSDGFLNIRTSFIGFDPLAKKGLIEWIINTKNKNLLGYTNQTWAGATTLQFAKLCNFLLLKNNFEIINRKTKILHFAPLGPMTKYELINSISSTLSLKKQIDRSESSEITRNLSSTFFDRKFLKSYTTEIKSALLDLKEFENS